MKHLFILNKYNRSNKMFSFYCEFDYDSDRDGENLIFMPWKTRNISFSWNFTFRATLNCDRDVFVAILYKGTIYKMINLDSFSLDKVSNIKLKMVDCRELVLRIIYGGLGTERNPGVAISLILNVITYFWFDLG